LQWEDDADHDMRILEVKNWKKVALDRDEWAKHLKARAHQGLFSQ
jgi:predicted alpha/beta hydrolase family esterase